MYNTNSKNENLFISNYRQLLYLLLYVNKRGLAPQI
jgi:hypothetical protein